MSNMALMWRKTLGGPCDVDDDYTAGRIFLKQTMTATMSLIRKTK